MKVKRKWFIDVLFLFALTGGTLLALLRGRDLRDLLEVLRNADDRWLIAGVGLVIAFILGESVIIHHILGKINSPLEDHPASHRSDRQGGAGDPAFLASPCTAS